MVYLICDNENDVRVGMMIYVLTQLIPKYQLCIQDNQYPIWGILKVI